MAIRAGPARALRPEGTRRAPHAGTRADDGPAGGGLGNPAAWIWPEHRDIAVEAIRELPAGDRATLEAMWASLKSEAGPQSVDPAQLTRAAGNNAHFLMPRDEVDRRETIDAYVARSLVPGTPFNATAVCVQHHALALRLDARKYFGGSSEDWQN